ncbi:MAG: radical SAM protein [Nitrososphaerota archaeon]|nr:B12-binding domain-containing radical SAM protein [Candidatus Bathyarchaeota archaeon]MDW8194589.1 radical SAM protein [Nitrososphaerota archaeon]
MRICLVNPPRIHPKSWGRPNVFQPIDLAYVAAVLESEHRVQILDAAGEGWMNIEDLDEARCRVGLSDEDIAYKIRQFSPDIVGINVPFSGWSRMAYKVASIVKNVDRSIITVLDGVHPSARPINCLEDSNVDYVVIGEAEATWVELARHLERGVCSKDLKNVSGIGFKDGDKAVLTEPRPYIQNLDSLPFPARHLLPMNIYFEAVKKNPLRGEINKPWTVMISSRGCPYKCIFCTAHLVRGRVWRGRSPENVIDELELLVERYNIKQVDFHDDNMTLDKRRVSKICDLIVEKKLDIEWFLPNGVRADTLDESLLIKMRKAGCRRVYLAPESGVQRIVNDVIKKNLDLKKVEEIVKSCRKVGIKVACFFVIGLIGETAKDIEASINFARKLRKLGADKFYFSYAMPLYGTELYAKALEMDLLAEGFNDDALSAVQPLIKSIFFTTEELKELCRKAYEINPKLSIEKLKNMLRNPRIALNMAVQILNKLFD